MTPLIEKYIRISKITAIASEKQFDEQIMNEFIRYLDNRLEQDDRHGFDEEDHESITLNCVCKYIDTVISEYRKGFSIDWAKEYANIKLNEENYNPASEAYFKVYKISREQSMKDLKLYSDLTERDELFIKHFCRVINIYGSISTPSAEEQAIDYSVIFKEQIGKGQSEIFADKYATLKSKRKFTELRCFVEATEYEKAILAGHSELFATRFADAISEYIANNYSTYEDSLNSELVEMERTWLMNNFKYLE